MKIYLNGEEREIQDAKSLADLLKIFDINGEAVVIEKNKEVVSRQKFGTSDLSEGDRIEIVHFIGGGAPEEGESAPRPEEGKSAPAPAPAAETKKPKPKKKKAAKKRSTATKRKRKGPSNLVVVESPAKARTINKFLGKDFQVEASMGHVRDLPKSKMGVDTEGDFVPHYIVISKARKRVSHLKKQAKGKESIYLAPDPDREGEAISWHLSHIFNEVDSDIPVHRVVFHEITRDAVLKAFEKSRVIQMDLVNAQQARRILDRIVGYELSPLLWKKVGRGLSAGRVQSVALRLIVDRERQIKAFVPEEYWSLEAKLESETPENVGKTFIAKLDKIGKQKAELKNKEQTEKIKQEVSGLPFKVAKVEKHERRRRPHAPFTTSKLQQEAYNRIGFPAAKTMRIAQSLYEGVELGEEGSVGLITYMRTDSVSIVASAQQEAIDYVREKFGDKYLPEKPPVYKSRKGAQEAHEAIRPTSMRREPDAIKQHLSDDELKLYDLIWRKSLASQMVPAVDEHLSVTIAAGDKYFFKTTGRRNIFPGFSIVYGEKKAPTAEAKGKEGKEAAAPVQDLPKLTVDEILKLHELVGNQHFTKPPPRFNDASIVKVLEEKGIGRPSTYAPTIYTLLSRDYVGRRGGALEPTDLGNTVVDLLVQHFPKIMEVAFTAGMETQLDKVEEGDMDWVALLRDFYGPFNKAVEVARENMKNVKREAIPTEYSCDLCNKPMVIKWGRFGKFLACSGFPDCKYTRSIPTGFRCPEPDCGGELVKRMSRQRRTFYGCSNYPKCTHIVNKLPKKEGEEDEQPGAKPASGESGTNGQ